ncbi:MULTISPECIES: pantoate--beta-alanine ligase [unclassified Paenibacillus]|uniref:pantoate--beta-alanine ligase n=1 Tax=unclassified Paenibacillus TaxID=185978 RepID=UPI001AEAD6F6|nr:MULTISPECIES: pantoate--beta-alanine ligase [unclassified Paenibacillus]MBP1155299.1 pantoate--beta-alanine ligase [Paenibacillus sp. PvP091]MBP1169317.1 pantoate--beta-alanine ligase [Paenibacillus sp. PvR098]MBP2440345.1 pantoate--beta-alanine ligase [Paenibacillus sp. PvP052]
MHTVKHIQELRQMIRQTRVSNPKARIGFVPTMGYLHQGHQSLLDAARRECDVVVLSIFVNPLQFGPNEDLSRYPREEERDMAIARVTGTDIVFFPQVEEMYPTPTKTIVSVARVTERLCGASRPGHFDGVATVVTKLLNIVQPDCAYFGMKDAQQVAVIEQMAVDLNIPVTIIPCPTVRESDGLAMSSRNVYLTEDERRQAVVLSQALDAAERMIRDKRDGLTADELREAVIATILTAPLAEIDYAEVLSYPALEPLQAVSDAERIIVALAVKFGRTRLIDNRLFHIVK